MFDKRTTHWASNASTRQNLCRKLLMKKILCVDDSPARRPDTTRILYAAYLGPWKEKENETSFDLQHIKRHNDPGDLGHTLPIPFPAAAKGVEIPLSLSGPRGQTDHPFGLECFHFSTCVVQYGLLNKYDTHSGLREMPKSMLFTVALPDDPYAPWRSICNKN